MTARNSRGSVTIREAYSRCYEASAAYVCAVTSHNNRRGDADGVLCESVPTLFCSASVVHLRVQLWSVNQRVTEAEEPPLL
jgi:hypothetical protein